MMWLNKTWKFLVLTAFRLLTAVALAFLALVTVSPVMMIVLCVLDLIGKPYLQGNYLVCWLLAGLPFWIGYNLYTDIKARLPKNKKKEGE